MTPEAALAELLARLGARNDVAVFVSDDEVSRWPAAGVAAMKSQGLLVRARPAVSVTCPGCEQACVMPVHAVARRGGDVASFVVCDKRPDINRVAVSQQQLSQWRCTAVRVRTFIAANLGVRLSTARHDNVDLLTIGIVSGAKRSQKVCLRPRGDLAVVVGDQAIPVSELIGFRDGSYSVDGDTIRDLVDSATTGDPHYTPSAARRESRKLDTRAAYAKWQKAYRDLKRRHPRMSDVWYSQQIAKTTIADGRSADTIRKHLKK
ncbi:MAG: hypothetical protein AB7N70_39285 [Dehalococcoidia bacterium]